MVCRRAALLPVVLMLLAGSGARAADQSGSDAPTAAPPPLELLEFLGQWETDDGEWIDPQALEDPELASLLEAVMEGVKEGLKEGLKESETAVVSADADNAGEDVNGANQHDGGSDDSN